MSFVCRGVIDAEGSSLHLEVEIPLKRRGSFFEDDIGMLRASRLWDVMESGVPNEWLLEENG